MTSSAATDETKRRKDGLDAAAGALGEITSLLMRSPEHAAHTIADLEWMLVSALLTRQYLIVRAQIPGEAVALPGACLLWASVSDEIDAQYRLHPGQRLKLSAEQRRSGNNIWITDLIGNRKMLASAIDRLRLEVFAARRVSYFGLDSDTRPSIVDLMPQQ